MPIVLGKTAVEILGLKDNLTTFTRTDTFQILRQNLRRGLIFD